MTHALITRLVVGEPTTLALGRPVGQTLATPTTGALRWKAGTWVGASTPRVEWLERVLRRREPQAIVVRTAAAPKGAVRARTKVAAAALAALGIGAAIPLAMTAFSAASSAPGDLPITPAAATAPVRVVAAAYMPPQPSLPAAATPPLPIATPNDGVASPLPFAPPEPEREPAVQRRAEQPKTPPVPPDRPPSPPAKAAVQKEQAPARAPSATPGSQREQKPVSAVVLDEAAPRGARPGANPPAATPPSSVPAKSPVAAAAAPSPAAATQLAPKPALERGTGLIAITPDSKVAVFTNPKTRLPQQFKIGDQLLSGDTIRSIDAKAGKVISSSKEYNLD